MGKEANKNLLRYSGPLKIRATDNNSHEFVISDSTMDRYHTVIPIDTWNLENYKKNPIVAYQHETGSWKSDLDSIIGKGEVWVEGNELIGRVTYEPADLNEKADKIRRKVDFGTLSSTSVGFYPHAGHWGLERNGEDPEIYYFDQVELVEFSIVNIPANPNAVKRSIEEYLEKRETPIEVEPSEAQHTAVAVARARLTLHQLTHKTN